MKLTAALLDGVVRPSSGIRLAEAIVASVQPGSRIELLRGKSCRVLQKSASADGIRLRIAHNGEVILVTAAEIAELRPVSSPLRRFANSLIRVQAAGLSPDQIINTAIRDAGLPTDPETNWKSILSNAYRPVFQLLKGDKEATEEAINDTLINELYERRALDRFNPEHGATAGKTLAQKVSAFLIDLFKNRVNQTIDAIKLQHGAGMQGAIGRIPNYGLDISNEEGEELDNNLGDLGGDGRGQTNRDLEDRIGREDLERFVREYKGWLVNKVKKGGETSNLAQAFALFIDMSAEGATHSDMKAALATSDLKMGDGRPLTERMCTTYLKRFLRDIVAFILAPENEEAWAKSTFGQQVLHAAATLYKREVRKLPTGDLNLVPPAAEEEEAEPIPVKAAGAAPASSNMLGVPGKPNDENYDSVTQALSGLMVERLEAPTPKTAQAPGYPSATPPVVVNQAPPPPTNPNVQAQNSQAAGIAAGTQTPQTAPAPESGFQAPPQNAAPQAHATQVPEIPGTKTITASSEDIMSEAPKKVTAQSLLTRRKASRTAPAAVKFARLKRVAGAQPGEVEAAFRELAGSYRKVAMAIQALRENLDLVTAPKEASVKEKTAARQNYGKEFVRLAAEDPEAIESALKDIYGQTDEIAAAVENLADHLGVSVAPTDDGVADSPEEAAGAVSEPPADFGGDAEPAATEPPMDEAIV